MASHINIKRALRDAFLAGEDVVPSIIADRIGASRQNVSATIRLMSHMLTMKKKWTARSPAVWVLAAHARDAMQAYVTDEQEVKASIEAIRRDRLKRLIAERFDGDVSRLSARIGHKGTNRIRSISAGIASLTERTARSIEREVSLPRGWLDGVEGMKAAKKVPGPATIEKVFSCIAERGPISRIELADATQLSASTVKKVIAVLRSCDDLAKRRIYIARWCLQNESLSSQYAMFDVGSREDASRRGAGNLEVRPNGSPQDEDPEDTSFDIARRRARKWIEDFKPHRDPAAAWF